MGYRSRSFGLKGLGAITVRVPRDRKGTYQSAVIPPSRRYDETIERDLVVLHLAGISALILAILSGRVLGHKVSTQEVSNALLTLVPAARSSLGNRRWQLA